MSVSVSDLASLVTGYLLDTCLFGAVTVQLYHYFVRYPEDRWYIKLVVNVVYLVSFVQTALVLYSTYSLVLPSTTKFSHQHIVISLCQGILSIIVAVITQSFYAYRVYLLSRKMWLAAAIVLMSFAQLVLALVTLGEVTVNMYSADSVRGGISTITTCLFAITGVCDIIIAIAMVFFLVRSGTDLASTNRLLKKVIRLTIETSVVTAGAATACLILYVVFPSRLYATAISSNLDKLYATALLAQLNGRKETLDQNEVTVEFASLEYGGSLRPRCRWKQDENDVSPKDTFAGSSDQVSAASQSRPLRLSRVAVG